ncbi:hypothetical protein ACFVG9_30025 [Saccharothrix carnea]|uniref:hypothetical protein n=1 Tax=Saccharothrix carnea TaxID=1280637 RepID=UPI003641018D
MVSTRTTGTGCSTPSRPWLDEVVEAGLATGNKKNALLCLIAARRIESPAPKFLEEVLHRVHRLV